MLIKVPLCDFVTAELWLFDFPAIFRLFRQKRMSGLDRSAGTDLENAECGWPGCHDASRSISPVKSSIFLQFAGTESPAGRRKSGNITHTSHSSLKRLIITLLRHAVSGQTQRQSERQFHR
ncbi:MAG TPA: hypothetical protein DC058_16175 [Planctomycetaceae bacterium]|nr:hypothetical protein [Planctomycetaceae bacterium]